jgi:hypothetical protein
MLETEGSKDYPFEWPHITSVNCQFQCRPVGLRYKFMKYGLTSSAVYDINPLARLSECPFIFLTEGTAMKVKIAQKDIVGYLFMLALAAVCITIGIKTISNQDVGPGIFSLVLGTAIFAAFASMVLRKE